MNYEQTLLDLAEHNEQVVVLTAENRAAIRNLPGTLGERFIDFGICEQTMVGAAAGLALRGRIPVVHALATFLTMRAFEFIRTDIGVGHLPVKLVGAVPGVLSDGNGPTHQALEDIALMRGIPGMEVFCPADEEELTRGMPEVLARPHPCYVRFNASAPTVEHLPAFVFGKAELLSDGDEITLLAFGTLLGEARKAADILHRNGRSIRLLNLRTLKPVDEEAVLRAAKETRLLVAIEDHFRTGGLFSIVSELLQSRGVHCSTLSLAMEDRWFHPALLQDVLAHEGFTGAEMAERIQKAWNAL